MRIFDILRVFVRARDSPSANRSPSKWHGGWLFGSIITMWGAYKSNLLRIEGDVEKAVEIVEDVAEAVENVASFTEEISKDVEQNFPEDGAVNKAAHVVEHLSEEAIKDAQNTRKFIEQMTSTEKIVETSIQTALEALKRFIDPNSTHDKGNGDNAGKDNSQKEKTNSKL
ncbi:hypothetical protein SUGI_0804450 [Cryptomeria japonica]|uniref:uncharacterized protein LOC131062432 n=1 Tax=Cryptomeria japonica TaxID=3369 RepID=UPI002414CA17|nr:uncharacterized protein LOC131062432 [Cryptomeria japonica]GLJ39392.1 hypothetical protein SUGI_0804450 [Cryptomeria japonica]